jgi:hypothetical protein
MATRGKQETKSGPSCVRCFGAMVLSKRVTHDAGDRLRYERRTFRCATCGHEQTYMTGTSDEPLGGHPTLRD